MRIHTGGGDHRVVNDASRPACYEFRIRGRLGETLLSAFPGLEPTSAGGDTLLRGVLPDQAALHAVFAQIEAFGLQLLEVRQVRDA